MILRRSITARVTLIFAVLSTLVMIAVGTIASYSLEVHFEEEDLHEINGKLDLIQHAFGSVVTSADIQKLPQKLDDALVGHPALSVTVYEPEGRVIYSAHDADFPLASLNPHPVPYHKESARLNKWHLRDHVYRGLNIQMPTARPDKAMLNVAIALDIEHHQSFISRFQQFLWMSLLPGIVIMVVLGWIGARRAIAPVRDFMKVAGRVSASRLNERIPVETLPKELIDLGLSFNDMLKRLQDAFQRLSDFSSDIAHELRTPVSNLMTQTHVALSQTRTIEEYQEILYSNIEEYERLSRMIADMLFLAKSDNGLIVPHQETMDLAREIGAVIEFYEPMAEEKKLVIACIGTAFFTGDRLMMRRAFSNLLSNSIRHSFYSERICVDIQDLGTKKIRVRFDNVGEPIPRELLFRIFDRFYRVDPSRQRNNEGTGLGLAITKSIIESHGGEISALSQEGGVRFEVLLPIAE